VRRALRIAGVALLVAAVAAGAWAALAWRELARFRDARFGSAEEKIVEVAPGSSARQVVRQLVRGGALSDERLAWRYLRLVKRDPRPLRAGEYAFAGPLLPDEVLERVYRGDVKTYRLTVPEGLRMEEIAALVEQAGLGKSADLLASMKDPAIARELGVPFANLEGYLFPDTYTFTRGPSPRAVVAAMVERFRAEWARADAQRAPGVTLGEREAVTLASIVEKETGRPDERPRISCVFHNRLRRGMRLQTDPTVMYATMLRNGGRWSRNISKADLLAPHPYNTYTTGGLPPGPIASPGAAALQAALRPAECRDLYFVSRNDGSHVFCPDLQCHLAAVREWQVEYHRRGRGAARPGASAASPRPAP
jgi:UPF0755 protein